jgi:hypothetical protein
MISILGTLICHYLLDHQVKITTDNTSIVLYILIAGPPHYDNYSQHADSIIIQQAGGHAFMQPAFYSHEWLLLFHEDHNPMVSGTLPVQRDNRPFITTI